MNFARKVFGQGPALAGNRGTILSTRLGRWFRRKLGLVGFELFQLELELFDLPLDLLRATPELHAS